MRFHVSSAALCLMCLSSNLAWAQSGAGRFYSADRPQPSHYRAEPVPGSSYWSDSPRLAQVLNAADAGGLPGPDETVGSGVERGASDSGPELGEPMIIPQEAPIDLGSVVSGDERQSAPSHSSGDCGPVSAADISGNGWHAPVFGGHHLGQGWFAGIYGLVFFRDDDTRGTVLAVDDTAPSTPILSTGSSRMKAAGGFETRFGKMLNACTAIEAVYWGIFPEQKIGRQATSLTPGNINSSLLFNGLEYDNGAGVQPLGNFFQGTQALEVRRDFEYHNIELNVLRLPWVFAGGGHAAQNARLALLAGARYFRADDYLAFASDFTNETFGDDPANELAYISDVENHLVGVQFGGMLDYALTGRLSGFFNSKLGIYGNHMTVRQLIQGGNGAAVIANGSFAGQGFDTDSKKNDVAFLGELDAGLSYQIGSHWRITGGYRVAAFSGIALAPSQIPLDFTDLASAAYVDDHDSLILHGTYAGVEFTW